MLAILEMNFFFGGPVRGWMGGSFFSGNGGQPAFGFGGGTGQPKLRGLGGIGGL